MILPCDGVNLGVKYKLSASANLVVQPSGEGVV
jgi:hypothetical protein